MTLPALPAQGSTSWYTWASGIHSAVASGGGGGTGLGPNVLNVRDYGATGDGTTNDSASIKTAEAALTNGKTLYFPAGRYRITTQSPAGGAALVISGKSRVAVVFEPGAELLMDNLNAGAGTGDGIRVVGSGSDIAIVNATVRWATQPSSRSFGEGFRFLGYPSDSAPAAGWTGSTGKLSNVRLVNCTTIAAPQTGAIFLGCSDVLVSNFRCDSTMADGLHLNACRRVAVNGVVSTNCGDDGLAFVTYHHASTLWEDPTIGPFWQNGLTPWSNTDSTASGIVVQGGAADGCRIAGAKNITVNGLTVDGKSSAGLIIDSAIANGTTITWTYVASRGISVTGVLADNCPAGILVQTTNIASTDAEMWWRFDARIADVTVRNASNWAIRTEGNGTANSIVAGLHFANMKVTTTGGNGVGFSSLRESYIGALVMDSTGQSVVFAGSDAPYTGALASLPRNGVIVDKIDVRGGRVLLQDFNGLLCGDIRVTDAVNSGVEFSQVANAQIGSVRVVRAHRANSGLSRGVYFGKVANMDVAALVIDHDANTTGTWVSFEIGGGDATDPAARALRIEKVVYTNTINQTDSDVVLQGGSFGPVNHYARVQFYDGGEASPVWRTQTVGTLPVFP